MISVRMFKYLLANVLFPLVAVAGDDRCQAYQSNLQCYILWSCYHSSVSPTPPPPLSQSSSRSEWKYSGTKTTDWHHINICFHLSANGKYTGSQCSVQIDSSLLHILFAMDEDVVSSCSASHHKPAEIEI